MIKKSVLYDIFRKFDIQLIFVNVLCIFKNNVYFPISEHRLLYTLMKSNLLILLFKLFTFLLVFFLKKTFFHFIFLLKYI